MRPEEHPEEVQRCLRVVWLNEKPSRYLPRAIGEGPAWEVWDRKRNQRVPTEDLATMTFEQITETLTN